MDDKPVEAEIDGAPATPSVTPEPKPGQARSGQPARGRRVLPWTTILAFVGGLVAVVAIALNAWTYAEGRREVLRLATEVAQLRLSLDLYANRSAPEAAASPDNAAALSDLGNRIAILEESWRNTPAPAAAPTTLPPIDGSAAAAPATASAGGEDCLPTSTRFMVSSGDRWPVCGTGAVLEIGSVDNGFISLADGTVIAQGGNIALPNSACMIGVLPGTGVSGYAEVRVTC